MPFLSHAFSAHPHGVAVDDGKRAWSYRDLSLEAETLARRLRVGGAGPGRSVAVAGRLTGGLLAALHGIWKAGAAVVPLGSGWTEVETDRALDLVAPDLLLVGEVPRELPGFLASGTGRPTFRLDSEGPPHLPLLPDSATAPADLPGLAEDGVAAHILTSGTSGRPRVVGITCGNLRASAEGSRERLALGPADRWYASLSISHIGGVALLTRAALLGSTLVARGAFDLPAFSSLVREKAITHASLVPTMLHMALESWGASPPPHALRCLLIGGAPARDALVGAALEAGLPIALTYGLTEASSQVATAPPPLVREKPGTVGEPLHGIRIRVTEDGELLVGGPTVAPGAVGEDSWLHTGDFARLDGEGHLWMTGRASDRIISGGVNVDPAEVERALEADSSVEEAVVVGIPDPAWGERVVAVVVPGAPHGPSADVLAARMRAVLSPAKRPRAIHFVDSIPRNPNGKVDREKIRALFS